MKTLNLLLAAAVAVTASTEASRADCRPCPEGTQDIALLIYDHTAFDTGFAGTIHGYLPYSWFDAGGLPMETYTADGPEEIPLTLAELAAGCKRIKRLGFYTHGDLGYVAFEKSRKGMDIHNVRSLLGPVQCAMAGDAWVGFGGCNVGRGCRGQAFMMEVARTLLSRGGGTVQAATNYVVGAGGINIGSINGDDAVLKVKPGIAGFNWYDDDGDPLDMETSETCRGRAQDAIRDIDGILSRSHVCGDGTTGDR